MGTFDTCFEGKPLEVVSATYNNVDITKKENNRELEQGNTLSVTVTADFIRGGSAVLCRTVNGAEERLTGYPAIYFQQQEDGRYTATLTCNIPANDFKWSGPQNVYVRLSTSGYTHIRTEDIPVGLKVIPDTEKPVLSGVSPNFGAGISGNAEFTLTATDNSGYVTQAKVEQSPYTGADNWTQITEGIAWDAGRLTLDTTKLTADITGNIKLRFTVADGGRAIGATPFPAPTPWPTAPSPPPPV